jgi:hypothetical protein
MFLKAARLSLRVAMGREFQATAILWTASLARRRLGLSAALSADTVTMIRRWCSLIHKSIPVHTGVLSTFQNCFFDMIVAIKKPDYCLFCLIKCLIKTGCV